jgi:hypothetical protein
VNFVVIKIQTIEDFFLISDPGHQRYGMTIPSRGFAHFYTGHFQSIQAKLPAAKKFLLITIMLFQNNTSRDGISLNAYRQRFP